MNNNTSAYAQTQKLEIMKVVLPELIRRAGAVIDVDSIVQDAFVYATKVLNKLDID